MKPAFIVFGNHGSSPVKLEDYFEYLSHVFSAADYEIRFSEGVVPGALNVLIESFEARHVQALVDAKKTPGTKFVLIATEVISGDSFNQFADSSGSATRKVARYSSWRRVFVRALKTVPWKTWFRKWMPRLYHKLARIYLAVSERSFGSAQYWADRFHYFMQVAKMSDSIWCVLSYQMPEYTQKFGAKVHLMPIASWQSECQNPVQGKIEKDIDFLFTGAVTKHRQEMLKALSARGHRVVVGTPSWPKILRDNMIARTRVCLQIRQHDSWKTPSVMRYHHLLCSGALIVGEATPIKCFQEQFVNMASTQDYIEVCERVLREGGFAEKGAANSIAYFEDSIRKTMDFLKVVKQLDGPSRGGIVASELAREFHPPHAETNLI